MLEVIYVCYYVCLITNLLDIAQTLSVHIHATHITSDLGLPVYINTADITSDPGIYSLSDPENDASLYGYTFNKYCILILY